VNSRAKELYISTFEQFFTSLQRKPIAHDLFTLERWDAILARHLGASLVDYHICRYMSGDRSRRTHQSILNCLALSSSAGNLDLCSSALGVHQWLEAEMVWPALYTTGTVLAMLKGDNILWNVSHSASRTLQGQLIKGLIQRMQQRTDTEQDRLLAKVLMNREVGPIDVDYQDANGDTVLNLFCQTGGVHTG